VERKLASIQVIRDIQPIPDADAIEVATVNAWKVVVRRDEFKVGDLCVYFEIDSFLPIEPEFEFLRKACYRKMFTGDEGFRLKTVRLRKQLSQGLIMSIKDIYALYHRNCPNFEMGWFEGLDITEFLGVKKYEVEIPVQMSGIMKGPFPSFCVKSDEERIQNLPNIITDYPAVRFYATEKLNGTSSMYFINNSEFGVCSRNIQLLEDDINLYWKIAKKYDFEKKLKLLDLGYSNIAIQGEIIGPGIQSNKYKLSEPTFNLFSAFYIDTQKYATYYELLKLAELMDIQMVPIIALNIDLSNYTIDSLIKTADGSSKLNYLQRREGLVYASMDTVEDTPFGKVSFKIVSNAFLEKE